MYLQYTNQFALDVADHFDDNDSLLNISFNKQNHCLLDISSDMSDQEINTMNLQPEKKLHQNVSVPCHEQETGIDQPEENVQPGLWKESYKLL